MREPNGTLPVRGHAARCARAFVALVSIAACGEVVEPEPLTQSIALDRTEVTLTFLGQTDSLAATPLGSDGTRLGRPVTWAVIDPSVASVSRGGTLTAAGDGETRAVATSDGVSAEVRVVVRRSAAELVLSADSIVLADPGDTTTVSAYPFDAGGAPLSSSGLTWSSADATIATVDGSGRVTASGPGTTTLTAALGTAVGFAEVRVLPELTLVLVGSTDPRGVVASALSLAVRVEDGDGVPVSRRPVTWTVASGGGRITSAPVTESDGGGFAGAVWELGTGAGEQAARAEITSRGTVRHVAFDATALPGPAVAMSLAADSVLLSARGETAFLAPSLVDEFGNEAGGGSITWSSDDGAVAAVAVDGLVTGGAAGESWIRGTLGASIDSILVTVVPRGAITITFDDGWLSAYAIAVPVMEEFGLVGNVGVYTEAVGWPAFMTEAQLAELHGAGWTLVSHSVTHDSLTVLSDAEVDYELRESQRWLVDRGYERGSDIFIAPYHEFGPRERLATSTYYEAARGFSRVDSLAYWKPDNPYELTGGDADKLGFTTAAGRDQIRALLQRTLDEGRFVDLFFHQFAATDEDAFRATLAIVDEFRERVLPYHEFYPRFARTVR